MAQLVLKDSFVLSHQGFSEARYRALPDFSGETHLIVDSLQSFPSNWQKDAWFWVPHLSAFFKRAGDLHPLLVAAKTQFSDERWREIFDDLESEGSIEGALNRLNLRKVRRNFIRCRNKGLITADEAEQLRLVFQRS